MNQPIPSEPNDPHARARAAQEWLDEVLGLAAIRDRGGVPVVQTTGGCAVPRMPLSAIGADQVDYQSAAADIGQR